MKIERACKRGNKPAKGFVMFGTRDTGKWFERWFETVEKATNYAKKQTWDFNVKATEE